jgi:16S rRNA G1207 methylase RsmC
MKGLLFIATLAAVALLPGCSGKLTLAQQQQSALNTFSANLALADNSATACIKAGVAMCVQNKDEIQKQAAKLAADVATAQTVITAGSDATSNLSTLSQEFAEFLLLVPTPQVPA